jgi:DNA-cytosine methyltransferase
MDKGLNVVSLFNGMSFGAMALDSLDIKVDTYYSSEIDKYANKATQALYPDVIQLGDVTKWREWDIDFSSIDLLIAGFPCQAWSMAGKQKGDNDPRGALVHDLIDIWNEIKKYNPDLKFMFENVKMKKEFLDYINNLFGVEPVCINSALVSAQNRTRYYWTNIGKVEQPEDKMIFLSEILEVNPCLSFDSNGKDYTGGNQLNSSYKSQANTIQKDKSMTICAGTHGYANGHVDKKYYLSEKAIKYINNENRIKKKLTAINGEKALCLMSQYDQSKNGTFLCVDANGRIDDKKTGTITSRYHKGVEAYGGNPFIYETIENRFRKLTPTECARLQTTPERHIDTLLNSGISNTQLYKMLGNGWTHDVITHIFKGLK